MNRTTDQEEEFEPPPMDRDALRVMMSVAAYHARGVGRRLRLDPADQADVEQDILIALLQRRRYFDPARGAWSTFLNFIVREIADDIAAAIRTSRHRQGLSLESVAPTDHTGRDRPSVLDAIADPGSPHDERLLFALSLGRFIAALPPGHAPVAMLALEEDGDLAEAQRRSGLSSSEFYRRLREIRYRLVCDGFVRRQRPSDDDGAREEAA